MNSLQFGPKAFVTAFVAIIALASCRTTSGQDNPSDSDPSIKKGLRFSVEHASGNILKPTSVIPVVLKLENTSKSDVYIYKELGFGPAGFSITILDGNENWVPPKLIAEQFPSPVLGKEDLQVIKAGKAIKETIDIRLRNYEITPGDYTLKIAYRSPVAPTPVTDGLTVLTSDDGPLQAKPIRFTVLAPVPE